MVVLPEHWLYSSAPYYAQQGEGVVADPEFVPLIEIVPIWEWFYDAQGWNP